MSIVLILAAALLVPQAAPAPSAQPELRLVIGDLDFTRPSDQAVFDQRVRDASRALCDHHLQLVTPTRLGEPAVCRAEVRRQAYRALPARQRQEIASTGLHRVIR